MSNSRREVLQRAEQLLEKEKYEEARQTLKTLEKSSLSSVETFNYYFLKSKVLNKLGHFEDALKNVDRAIHEIQYKTMPLQWVDAFITRSEALLRFGKLNESLEALTHAETGLAEYENKHSSEFMQMEGLLLYFKALIFLKRGDLDQALEYIKKSLSLREQTGTKLDITRSLLVLGMIYHSKGDLNQSLEYYKQSLTLAKETGNKKTLASCFNNIGIIHDLKGDLGQALDAYRQSLSLYEAIGNKQDIAASLINISQIYRQQGRLSQALKYCQLSLAHFEEIKDIYGITVSWSTLGLIHHSRGNFEQALECFEKTLPLYETLPDAHGLSESLLQMVSIAIDKSSPEQAQYYLQYLHQFDEQEKNKLINQRYRVAQALVLKTSDRVMNRGKAEEILRQVVNEDIIEHELTVKAMLNLCDLLLLELKTSGDVEILQDVKDLIHRLLTIAKTQTSYLLLAETYVLQAKLALLELHLATARHLLTQAQIIAEERGLHRLAVKISSNHDLLLDQIGAWEEFIHPNTTLAKRAELVQLDDMIKYILQRKSIEQLNLPIEEPVLFLITNEGGICLFSKTFPTNKTLEDQLVGGFLSAVNSFSTQVFSCSIDRIKFGDYTILMKPEESLLICYVFRGGSSYLAQQKLSHFTNNVRNNLVVWEGLNQASQRIRSLELSTQKILENYAMEIFLFSP
ncbi:MAG: tetratricopeptide repeat protein [Candidatus Hodarchaeota archaeon]